MYIQVLFLVTIVTLTMGQSEPRLGAFGRKPGDCPIRPDVGICELNCFNDLYCLGSRKCCRTACGGSFCTNPVRPPVATAVEEKPGDCPKPSRKGPWVCSNQCAVDKHCRGTKKCCKTRCGGLACIKPAEEEINEIPLY